ALYPTQAFSQVKYNQLNSWLYTELKAFLRATLPEQDPDFPLIREFNRRELIPHRDRLIQKVRREFEQLPEGAQLRRRFQFESLLNEMTDSERRTQQRNLQNLGHLLDQDFISEKLRQSCLMRSHENVFRSDYDYGLLDIIMRYTQEKGLLRLPSIAAYYHAYHFLSDPDSPTHYAAFQRVLKEQSAAFTQVALRELYLFAINYCIRQMNRGQQTLAKEALSLYRRGLEQHIFTDNGFLSPHTYRNAAALGLSLKEFDWTEQFIHEWGQKLEKEQRQKLLHYNLARLAYARGLPDQALEELRYVKTRDTLFTLSMEVFRAKIYYECDDHDLLDHHLEKVSIYLRRNNGSYHFQHYQNFVKYCRKLLRLSPFATDERAHLKTAIQDEQVLTEKKWLLQQLS
ncbi:MAG: hypothetical protein AAF828_10950, partial [Bacteroidota bacterium]